VVSVMPLDIETSKGIRYRISDMDGDDLLHDVVSVLVRHPEGAQVRWRLPKRLMMRLDVGNAVQEEILAELEERMQQAKRLGL
jgi:hypothetical protein